MCIASYKASYVGAIANIKIALQLATGGAIKLASEDFILSCDHVAIASYIGLRGYS